MKHKNYCTQFNEPLTPIREVKLTIQFDVIEKMDDDVWDQVQNHDTRQHIWSYRNSLTEQMTYRRIIEREIIK